MVNYIGEEIKVAQITSGSLLPDVINSLKGREAFTDTNEEMDEKMYTADVWATILGEQIEIADLEDGAYKTTFLKSDRVIQQLRELDKQTEQYQYIHIIA